MQYDDLQSRSWEPPVDRTSQFVCVVLYLLVFTIGFEGILTTGWFSATKALGILLAFGALYRPKEALREFPVVAKCWLGVIAVNIVSTAIHGMAQPVDWVVGSLSEFGRHLQMLLFLWICWNLLKQEHVARRTIQALGCGAILLALCIHFDLGVENAAHDQEVRLTLGAKDANAHAMYLAYGLVSCLGLFFLDARSHPLCRWFYLAPIPLLAIAIGESGSRGAVLACILGLIACAFQSVSARRQFYVWSFIIATALTLVICASFSEAFQKRWQRTFERGDTAHREEVWRASWDMFTEKPLIGWGEASAYIQVGKRSGLNDRVVQHNEAFWLLSTTGILGFIPATIGALYALRAAWKARHGPRKSLPLAMLIMVFACSMTLISHTLKPTWLLLAYAATAEAGMHFRNGAKQVGSSKGKTQKGD